MFSCSYWVFNLHITKTCKKKKHDAKRPLTVKSVFNSNTQNQRRKKDVNETVERSKVKISRTDDVKANLSLQFNVVWYRQDGGLLVYTFWWVPIYPENYRGHNSKKKLEVISSKKKLQENIFGVWCSLLVCFLHLWWLFCH